MVYVMVVLACAQVTLSHLPQHRTEEQIRQTRKHLATIRDPRRGGWAGGDRVKGILTYDDLVNKNVLGGPKYSGLTTTEE